MLRSKFEGVLLSVGLCVGLVGCPGEDDDEPSVSTGNGVTVGMMMTDGNATDASGGMTGSVMTTSGGDTMEGSSSGEESDTAVDACADVMCLEGETCIGGVCVPDKVEPVEPDPNYPNPDDGCPAGTISGVASGLNICLPACDGAAANVAEACPQPATGTATGVCALGDGSGSGDVCGGKGQVGPGLSCPADDEWCLGVPAPGMGAVCTVAVACIINCAQGMCPDGMMCNDLSACVY